MDFIDALLKAKKVLRLSDSQIARDVGKSRQWVGVLVHREREAPPRSKHEITKALCRRIDGEIVKHAEEVSRLERIRADLIRGLKEK